MQRAGWGPGCDKQRRTLPPQEWNIIGVNTSTWRVKLLAPHREPRSAPLEGIMMAVTPVRWHGCGGMPALFAALDGSSEQAQASCQE